MLKCERLFYGRRLFEECLQSNIYTGSLRKITFQRLWLCFNDADERMEKEFLHWFWQFFMTIFCNNDFYKKIQKYLCSVVLLTRIFFLKNRLAERRLAKWQEFGKLQKNKVLGFYFSIWIFLGFLIRFTEINQLLRWTQ